MRVVGTAGHVDHGKSTLVKALTGINPDRLREEQEREMTIELGFAWLTLSDDEEIGVVDVPGHRDFIENMLAGIGGIDAAIFVVAADEGVMPQTREHLAILDILQIQSGIVAITKTDLIDDPEWLDLVEMDVTQVLENTVLADAPIVRVSARNGEGLDEVKQVLMGVLAEQPHRPDLGRPRLPIDRVFTISGFGTVVTGTLLDGQLQVGKEVIILPPGLRGRVRGLQNHKRKEDFAAPGSRTAVNISGVDVNELKRGYVVAQSGAYQTTRRLDVFFRLLPDAAFAVQHNDEVKLHIGATEVVTRLRLLGAEILTPGEEGWLQLEPVQPVVAARGDRYILRRPSPSETLGGGVILDPYPGRRHKRFSTHIIERLKALYEGTPDEVLLQAAAVLGIVPAHEVAVKARLSDADAGPAMEKVLGESSLIALEGGSVTPKSDVLVAPRALWESLTTRALQALDAYHILHPLRLGVPREELKSRLKMSSRIYSAALKRWIADGLVKEQGGAIGLLEHKVQFNETQQKKVDHLLDQFKRAPYAPPTIKDCHAEVGEDVYLALIGQGKLVSVSPEVVFRYEDYWKLAEDLQSFLRQSGSITVAEFRDRYQTTRRYALGFLEHLDSLGATQRRGDERVAGRSPLKLRNQDD
jgi:selenocysteine-specific elongation factor